MHKRLSSSWLFPFWVAPVLNTPMYPPHVLCSCWSRGHGAWRVQNRRVGRLTRCLVIHCWLLRLGEAPLVRSLRFRIVFGLSKMYLSKLPFDMKS
ncbi:hypothetical protein F8388_011028 [Cannabis sativa]|uniref:Secreted protein n=1 Tax=Cannabis sativa TaxID=3483 RepID=A0A7J6FGD8_CANSA|nr:hypothetical protein G4B88_022157 [Cannabis sativa]KAF4373001.1 hypothetical protein F8388_011028 [Cannabis sativa]